MSKTHVKAYHVNEVSDMENIKDKKTGNICFVERYPVPYDENNIVYKKSLFICDSDLKWLLVSTNLNDYSRA